MINAASNEIRVNARDCGSENRRESIERRLHANGQGVTLRLQITYRTVPHLHKQSRLCRE